MARMVRRITRKVGTRWMALLSLAMAGVTGLVVVRAVHDTGVFQLDADAPTSTAGFPANTGADDWDRVCYEAVRKPVADGGEGLNDADAAARCFLPGDQLAASKTQGNGGATAVSWVAELNPASSIFTSGGSKDPSFISSWRWKDDSNAPPDKDNLVHAYAARYSLTPSTTCPSGSSTCEVLFFGSDRFDNSGDAQQAFWFLQSKVTTTTTVANGAFTFSGEHKAGDVLVISDFSNGGTTSTISIYKWDNPRSVNGSFVGCSATNKAVDPTNINKTVTDTTCADANLRVLGNLIGDAANCRTVGSQDGKACGLVNEAGITMPWLFVDKSGTANNGALAGEFYEAGINLSAFNLGDECFSSVVAETRSSTSTTATLKDFVVGQLGSCETTLSTTASLNGSGTSIISSTTGNGTAPSGTDTAVLQIKGTATWGGTLAFYLCGPLGSSAVCDANGVLVTSRSVSNASQASDFVSGSVTLTSAGRYCWFTKFTPDSATAAKGVSGAEHAGSGSGTANPECFVVSPVTPTLTTLSGGTVNFGSAVTDSATLSGAAKEPGTNGGNSTYPSINATNGAFAGQLAFTLKGPDTSTLNCTTNAVALSGTTPTTFPILINVTGNTTYSSGISFTPNSPGTYHWIATYNGPGANGTAVNNVLPQTFNNACNETTEDVTVQQIPSAISTGPSDFPQDTASIKSSVAGDKLAAGGSVLFELYSSLTACNAKDANGRVYTETKSNVVPAGGATEVTGIATNNTTFRVDSSKNGTYYWRVKYTPSDSVHTARESACVENSVLTHTNDAYPGTLPQ